MRSVSVHSDFFKQIRKHTDEEIGRFFRALASDVDGSESPELPPTLEMLKEMIGEQNSRFSEQQKNKRVKPKKPTQPNLPNEPNSPKEPTQPPVSVTESITDTKIKKCDPPKSPFAETEEPLRSALRDFSEMRKKIKAPLTDKAERITLSELNNLAPGDIDTQVKIIEQSIQRNWRGVFELKGGDNSGRFANSNCATGRDGQRGTNILRSSIPQMDFSKPRPGIRVPEVQG